MGHGKHKGFGFHEVAPVPVANYNVTGEITPDAKCNYFVAGWHDGKLYYLRADGAYFIYWSIHKQEWWIDTILGDPDPLWQRADPNIIGEYAAREPAVGIATVAAGPH